MDLRKYGFTEILANGVQHFGTKIVDFASNTAVLRQLTMPMMTAPQFYPIDMCITMSKGATATQIMQKRYNSQKHFPKTKKMRTVIASKTQAVARRDLSRRAHS